MSAANTVACHNQVNGCWREFSLSEPHYRLSDLRFCSKSCAADWTATNELVINAADLHSPRTAPRTGAR
jgi:hypothetical protein